MRKYSIKGILKAAVVFSVMSIGALFLFVTILSNRISKTSYFIDKTDSVINEMKDLFIVVYKSESNFGRYIKSGDAELWDTLSLSNRDGEQKIKNLKSLWPQGIVLDSLWYYFEKRKLYSAEFNNAGGRATSKLDNEAYATLQMRYYSDKIYKFGKQMMSEVTVSMRSKREQHDGIISDLTLLLYGELTFVLVLSLFIIRHINWGVTRQEINQAQISHLANMVEQSSDAIISISVSKLIISWNKGAQRLFGFSSDEAIGATGSSLGIYKLTETEVSEIFRKIMNEGRWTTQMNFYHRDGSVFYGSISATLVKEPIRKSSSIVIVINDISIRKKLEDHLLRANEELEEKVKARTEEILKRDNRFRALIENSAEVISLMNESFEVIYRSPSAFRVTGFANYEVLGKVGTQNIHPEDQKYILSIIKEIMAHPRKPIICRFRNKHKKGHYIWIEGVAVNMLQDLSIQAIVFNFHDITERLLAEEKLINSEIKFRSLIENISDAIVVNDDEFKIIYQSPSVTKILGYLPEDRVNRKVEEFIHPESLTYFFSLYDNVRKNPYKAFPFEYQCLHKEGHYVWIEGVVTNMIHDPVINAYVANYRDITEKKNAQQKFAFDHSNLQALINNTEGMMWSMNQNFKLITSNQPFNKAIFALTGSFPEVGTDFHDMKFNDDILHKFREYYERAFSGEIFSVIEYSEVPEEMWSEISFCPIVNNDRIGGVACYSRDITKTKKAEIEIQKSYKENQDLAQLLTLVLDTLPANIAILDKDGTIKDVNQSWRLFAIESNYNCLHFGVGDNYLEFVKNSITPDSIDRDVVYEGLKNILCQKQDSFIYEYAFHSSDRKRWFRMVATHLNSNYFSGIVIMHIDISEVKQLEMDRLANKVKEQKRITLAMLKGQELERNAIGIELHDNVNQILVSTRLLLSLILNDGDSARDITRSCIDNLDKAILENRKISHELVLPDMETICLKDQISALSVSMLNPLGVEFEFDRYCIEESLLESQMKLMIYRIIQEQFSNIVKHSKATKVLLQLDMVDNNFHLRISDNGIGMGESAKFSGIGIRNIKWRVGVYNGKLGIQTSENNGFVLDCLLPV